MGSVFDGRWRPDPQRPGPDAPIVDIEIGGGRYACQSCEPPYEIPADEVDHDVAGNATFDAVAVRIVDDRTVQRTHRRRGLAILEAEAVLAADGASKVETQLIHDQGPRPFRVALVSNRVGPAPVGCHALSGRWQLVEADMVDHEEDTSFGILDEVADGLGRSYEAPLDGTRVPYVGDARYDSVSVHRLDDRTIEETDRLGDMIVLLTTWQVDPDGQRMHVRFDDTRGRVMEQTGHRLP